MDVVREDSWDIWAGVDVKAGIMALIWEASVYRTYTVT